MNGPVARLTGFLSRTRASGGYGPLVAGFMTIAVYFAYAGLRDAFVRVNAFDTGLYLQFLHNIAALGSFASGITGEQQFLAHHFQPLVLLLAPAVKLFASPLTLHAAAAASVIAAILVFHRSNPGSSLMTLGLLSLACIWHPSVASAVYHSFVPEVMALPLLMYPATRLIKERVTPREAVWCIALLTAAGLGKETLWITTSWCLLLVPCRERRCRWLLVAAATLHAAAFCFLFFRWMPAHTAMPSYYGLQFYLPPGVSGQGVLTAAVWNNLLSITSLKTLTAIAASTALLPFLSFNRALAAALPVLGMILASWAPQVRSLDNHYLLPAMPFLLASALHTCERACLSLARRPAVMRLAAVLPVLPLAFLFNGRLLQSAAAMAANPHFLFLDEDIKVIKARMPGGEHRILTDSHLTSRFLEYPEVKTVLAFLGHPHPLTEEDLRLATDVIVGFNVREKGQECEAIGSPADDRRFIDAEAFRRFCHWLQANAMRVDYYPRSRLYHFRY